MTTKVAALSESFSAPRALEWPLSCVLSEMVTEVATFLEYAITALKFAFEVQFIPLSLLIFDLDGLMPVIWYPRERFGEAMVFLKFWWSIGILIILHV